jgi:nucleotide-binding universal stress UspA family protein
MTSTGATIMIKDAIVNLTVGAPRDVAADYAISLGNTFGAHLCGIGFAYEAVIPGTVFGGVATDLIQAQRAASHKAARTAIEHFQATARTAGVSAEAHLIEAGVAAAADSFGRLAHHFDLAVLAQAEPDQLADRNLIIEVALFGSGRPLLIVPYIQQEGLKLDHVTVCWDGSRNAARALADAMPFLSRAKEIEIVVVAADGGRHDEMPFADIGAHLARHGLKVKLQRIVAGDLDVTNTILSHAADAGSDLIVMGGYGHSRLREFVLGGVTRGILGSMTVPTLMAH